MPPTRAGRAKETPAEGGQTAAATKLKANKLKASEGGDAGKPHRPTEGKRGRGRRREGERDKKTPPGEGGFSCF